MGLRRDGRATIVDRAATTAKDIPIVAQASKQGFLYVFNRATGKPLWPIEERAVPASNMPDEEASPTQPFPTAPPPFARQAFTVADLNPYILSRPIERAGRRWWRMRSNHGLFTPPGLTDTIEMPGNHGGVNWGMTAANPTNGTMYVVSMDIPAILKNERTRAALPMANSQPGAPAVQGKAVYHFYCERCHGPERAGAPPAIPSLVNAPSTFGADTIKSVVNYGLNDMPAFPDLTDRLLNNLLLYLGNPASAPEPNPSRNEAPSAPASAASDAGSLLVRLRVAAFDHPSAMVQ